MTCANFKKQNDEILDAMTSKCRQGSDATSWQNIREDIESQQKNYLVCMMYFNF